MTDFLIRIFVGKNKDAKVCREKYGNLASITGIVCNVILFAGKFLIGVLFGSMAIAADAFNNLTDAGSSVVSLIGFKLGAKEPDEEHPYGHARYEYLAGLGVCVMIIAIGLNLAKEGIGKIIHPAMFTFSWLSLGVLVMSILVKLWLAGFYTKIAGMIDSSTLRAAAADSRNDCISTGAVLLAAIITMYTNVAVIDGIMATVVAIYIIFSGYGLMKEAIDPLLGGKPDEELVGRIEERIMSYEGVLGFHDLMVHDYGPGRQFASVHVELPAEMDTLVAHEIIDNIEMDFLVRDEVQIVVHYDPIVTTDERIQELKLYIDKWGKAYDGRLSVHDLRIVPGEERTNVIFDLVLPAGFNGDKDDLVKYIKEKVRELDTTYNCVIKVEQSFSTIVK